MRSLTSYAERAAISSLGSNTARPFQLEIAVDDDKGLASVALVRV